MPRFHFHLRTEDGLEPDETGTDFADLEAAYLESCRTIPSLMAELVQAGRDPNRCTFEIADTEGRPMMEVPFLERVRRPARVRRPDGGRQVDPETAQLLARLERLRVAVAMEVERLRDNIATSRLHVEQLRAFNARTDLFQRDAVRVLGRGG